MSCRGGRPRPLAALLAITLALPAARAVADGAVSATVAATTDYIFRGVSQTYGGAALQGSLNYQRSDGWFAGIWASNVDPYPGGRPSTEIDAYGGFGWSITQDWTARATYTRYSYAWDRRPKPYDYDELALALAFQDRVTLSVAYEPDATGKSIEGYVRNHPAAAYELSSRWPLVRDLALTAGIGYYDLSHLFHLSYWAGSAGLEYSHGPLRVDLAHFTNDHTVSRLYEDASADGEWVLSAAWRF